MTKATKHYIPGRWLIRHGVINNIKVTFTKFCPSIPITEGQEVSDLLWTAAVSITPTLSQQVAEQLPNESFKDFKERVRDALEELEASRIKGKHGEVIPLQFRISHKRGDWSHAKDEPFGGGVGVLIRPEDAPKGLTHVITAHELGHKQFEREHPTEKLPPLENEVAAWKNAANTLRKSGEWNKRAKALATEKLSTRIEREYSTSKSKAREIAKKIVEEL